MNQPSDELMHYGVKGVKWGVRREPERAPVDRASKTAARNDGHWIKKLEDVAMIAKIDRESNVHINREGLKLVKEYTKRRIDISQEGPDQDRFVKDLQQITDRAFDDATEKHLGPSPSGLYRAVVRYNPNMKMITVTVVPNSDATLEHSDTANTTIEFIIVFFDLDERGYPVFDEEDDDELLHHGVKGMKWGVRRSSRVLRIARNQRKEEAAKSSSKPEAAPQKKSSGASSANSIQNHVETSTDRYNRLSAQAREGRANDMTEQDLKFYNARAEALKKIEKMNEVKPSWLAATAKDVLQETAKAAMKDVAGSAAKKYISGPIVKSITK